MTSIFRRKKIMTVFGTRPEIIKLAPIMRALDDETERFETVHVASGQHRELCHPLIRLFGLRIDCDLRVMRPKQSSNQICSRVMSQLDPILAAERPALVLVQGDTTTATAGALAAFYRGIPVGHVEAGLRTGDIRAPYPEEMNRRLITRLAAYHFAATPGNRNILLSEGVERARIFVTGNPVVDCLRAILRWAKPSPALTAVLEATNGLRRIVLTTHRRESFGAALARNLTVVRRFADRHADVAVIFPVHPNPSVATVARRILGDHPRIHLTPPLLYSDFIVLLSRAWLIVSDSGGIQEEAPSLGKPLLILRENTERPECLQSGMARLVGRDPNHLAVLLEEARRDGSWTARVRAVRNPFGSGNSAQKIKDIIAGLLAAEDNHGYRQKAANA
jgi:UDP-N-acetylglucosamine 2-epimerase (non-hydrolysing)